MIVRRAALLVVLALGGCRACSEASAPVDAGPAGLVVKRAPALDASADAVALVSARVPQRNGSCAQVRSIQDATEANAVADRIRAEKQLDVDVIQADLGERGIWHRLCVGREESEARLVARATRWTAPSGDLEPYLDPPTDDRPRFHVLTRESADPRRASVEQARALLGFALVDDAQVWFAGGPAKDALVLASTAATEDGGTDVVAIDAKGARLTIQDAPPTGCASCTLALREGRVRARRAVGSGDVSPHAGDELLVEEDTDHAVRFLSLMAVENGALVRVAGVVLENARPGFAQMGRAVVVEADADAPKEVVVATREMRINGDVACTLESHAIVYDLAGPAGFARVDPLKMPVEPDDAVINVVTALDEHGDHRAASRACAAQLGRAPKAAITQLCLQRVRRLVDKGALVDAVNAAGLAAEASPPLRAVIAAPFHAAAEALDRDPRLFAGENDCAKDPLVVGLATRTLGESLKLAEAKQRERVNLGDVADAVFVTGIRDFGGDSPVGGVVARWLERVQLALPAKAAAVEALLLPQAPDPPDAGAAVADAGTANDSFGGAP